MSAAEAAARSGFASLNDTLGRSWLTVVEFGRGGSSRFFALARELALLAFALAATSCSGDEFLKRATPPDVDARSREYLELFTHRQTDAALARVPFEMQTPEARQKLAAMTAILAGQHFDSTKVIGANLLDLHGIRHAKLTYELHSAGGWYLANISTIDSAGDWRVDGVAVDSLRRPLEQEEWFPLRGQTSRHYLWLSVALLGSLISIGSAIFIATRRQMPRRGWWVLGALVGIGSFTLNWSNGAYAFSLASVQLFAGGWVRAGPYSPIMISFSIPIGAILALRSYRRWKAAGAAQAPESTGPEQASTATP